MAQFLIVPCNSTIFHSFQINYFRMFPVKSLLVFIFLFSASTAADLFVNYNCSDYDGFLRDNCKREPDTNATTYQLRKAIFEKNCNGINEHNSKNDKTYSLVAYCDSIDLLPEQEKSKLGLNPVKTAQAKQTTYPPQSNGKVSATVLPTSLNYVTLGYVTSIKNQGTCGCCWSFASIAMYESVLLKHGSSYGLSQQASLECTNYYSPGNRVSDCSGGYFEDPLIFLAKVGGVLRSTYPYISGSYGDGAGFPYTPGICSQTKRISIGNGTSRTYSLTQTQIKTLLVNQGPVMVGVYANTAFTQYSSGIFSGCPSDAVNFINHAVLLVGYDDSTQSWLLKNQWASSWGESGYMRLSYNSDCGMKNLLGNVYFTSYNSNPSVTVSSSLLYSNSPKGEWGLFAGLAMVLLVLIAIL